MVLYYEAGGHEYEMVLLPVCCGEGQKNEHGTLLCEGVPNPHSISRFRDVMRGALSAGEVQEFTVPRVGISTQEL
jgi:hypothetical protein